MRKQIGKQGEDIAVRYLEQQGYRILNRNYHSRYGEIDVICERQRVIIFVEVKTRRSESYGTAEEAVTRVKQQRLRETISSMNSKGVKVILMRGRDLSSCLFRFFPGLFINTPQIHPKSSNEGTYIFFDIFGTIIVIINKVLYYYHINQLGRCPPWN